jgi:23S rRNA pseudouridine1911/1915/1917 synthase
VSARFKLQKEFIVSGSLHSLRLDRCLQELTRALPEALSRSKAAELIDMGLVALNGKPTKASSKVKEGDLVFLQIPEAAPSSLQSFERPLKIYHEDSAVVVVSKPAGLVVHPAAGHAQDTLVNVLLGKFPDLSVGFHEQRPGIVHRLDKDTSGILVVAKTHQALENLAAQFKAKTVHRLYHALVYGKPAVSSGRIESFLARHPVHRKKFHSAAQGKRAVTHFRVLASARGLSLLECRLETGRTHQIRVHLSEKECPIVGDPIYGTPKRLKALSQELALEINALQGIGLHAFELGFNHPVTGEFLKFHEDWPENLLPLVQKIGFENV